MIFKKAEEKIPTYHLYGDKIGKNVASFYNIGRLEERSEKSNVHHPHRHLNLFQIIWVTDGVGNIMVDEKKYEMRKGTLFCISPGVVHACENSTDFKGFVIHFSPDVLLSQKETFSGFKTIDGIIHDKLVVVKANKTEQKKINTIILDIWSESDQEYIKKDRMISSYLNILMIQVQRQLHSIQDVGLDRSSTIIVNSFREKIELHYKQERSVAYYASLLHITPTYLNDTVKKITGKTAGELIRERIILEAKRLLIFSTLSTSEIAFELSFEDNAYFWKFFKKYVSISPKKFRDKNI
ncbi:AraC family transcriptional regulator [Aquimarina sp. 2304DJ70-9]|uniref:AraC family transcriptional regulator n=1 Tax=Aquimarina penaris TaxID=3231044 RepID=UPI003461E314